MPGIKIYISLHWQPQDNQCLVHCSVARK